MQNVTNMVGMFSEASSFSGDSLSGWHYHLGALKGTKVTHYDNDD
jgi:hypothetical protein